MATGAPEPSAIRRPSASARCVIISVTSRLTLVVARSPRSWSTGPASSTRLTDTLAFATATTLWTYSASRPRPQPGRRRRAEQPAASRCRRSRASPTLRSMMQRQFPISALRRRSRAVVRPGLSSAACDSGPLFTAASACSNSSGVAMPTRIVPIALCVIAKRTAASARLPAWPCCTSGISRRARCRSAS